MYYSNTKSINLPGINRIRAGYFFTIVISLILSGCVVIENQYEALAPGMWRAHLILDKTIAAADFDEDAVEQTFDELVLPVMFEVKYDEAGKMRVIWQNGEERIVSDSVMWGWDRATGRDTLRIEFPVFDTHISAVYEERVIEGYWEVHYKESYRIPFVANYGKKHRFERTGEEPAADLTGRWACVFAPGEDRAYPAIAELRQEGNRLTGTFLTETGDYRYLEGVVQGEEFAMSTFDGAHAYLFSGKITSPDSIVGSFHSGTHYRVVFEGYRDADAQLRAPTSINKATTDGPVFFEGTTPSGSFVSTQDEVYRGKPKVIQLMGTWCPNCKDATRFLLDYFHENPEKAEAVGLFSMAFEAYRDSARSMEAIARYIRAYDVPFPVVLGGYKDKAEASASVPVLDGVSSYPTLLILDKDDRIRYIHAGFAGPATSEYEQFGATFEGWLEELLQE
jgi:thiol-disulfide isomerase/thioredoxin